MNGNVVRIDEASVFELLTIGTLFLVAIMGTLIAYQAYRGYRRNDARSMLYLAIGLLLLTLCPFVINVTINTLASPDQVVTVFFENVSRLFGLAAIMYSLYGQH
ncbi:DUF7521 family protein [Halosolutus halophilus]|uniref:DUF7521 family protein n=1 Tax=Halosolutus halophilus TaxID=1552990 RepID=UPI0022350D71|nr:hypothetical protein [Halosolutus halophilus]